MINMKIMQGVFVLLAIGALSSLHSLDIEIYPSTICYQEHDNLVLRCIFSGNDTSGAEFLFKSRDKPGEAHKLNTTKLNSNTIETRVQDIKIPDNIGTYFCAKDGKDHRQITYIEEKVVLPDDVQCYHDQLYQSLICEWTGRNSTCWDFSIVNSDLGYYVIDHACNVSTPCTELSPIANCVQARHSSDVKLKAVCPRSNLDQKQIDFKITGRKLTSVSSRIIHKTIDCSSVKLRVTNVQRLNSSSKRPVLAWEVLGTVSGNCDCMKQCEVTTNQSSPVIITRSCNNDTLYTVELNHLQQVTDYTIAVKCTVIGSEVWSDEQLVTLTTPFEVPLGGLLAGPDLEGYVMYTCQERFYCLILYWKDLGNVIKMYKIHVSDRKTSFELEVPYSPIATIRLNKTRNCQQFHINVYGVTTNGMTTQTTSFRAMDHACGCFNHIVCSVVKGNGSHVNLKLTEQGYPVSESTGGSNSCEVTLFWCVGYKRDSHVECENFIQWSNEVLNKSTAIVPINSGSHNGSLHVGLGFRSNGQTTGIDWNTCLEKSNSNDISTTGDISVIVVVVSAVCAFCIVILFILMFGCSRRKCIKEKCQYVVNNNISMQTINSEDHEHTEGTEVSSVSHQEIDSYVCSVVVDQPSISSTDQNRDGYDGNVNIENTNSPLSLISNINTMVIDDKQHTDGVEYSSNPGTDPGYLSPNELTPTSAVPRLFLNQNISDETASDNSSCCHDGLSLRARLSTKSISSYCTANDLNQFSEYATESERRTHSSKIFCEVDNNLDYISTEGIDSIDGKIRISTEENNQNNNEVHVEAHNNQDYIAMERTNSNDDNISNGVVNNMDYIST